jgi:hypothetical protein
MVPEYLIESNEISKETLFQEIQGFLLTIPGFNSTNRRPNINITNFMNLLYNSKWISDVKNLDQFKDKIIKQNSLLSSYLSNPNFIKSQDISNHMIEKWNLWGNYIGVDKNFTWLYN